MRVERLIRALSGRAALPGSALLLAAFYVIHWVRRLAGRSRLGLDLARRNYADDL